MGSLRKVSWTESRELLFGVLDWGLDGPRVLCDIEGGYFSGHFSRCLFAGMTELPFTCRSFVRSRKYLSSWCAYLQWI